MKKNLLSIMIFGLSLITAGCSIDEKFKIHMEKDTTEITSESNTDSAELSDSSISNNELDWCIVNRNDEFGDPSGKMSLACAISDGEFSNSATTNSTLGVVVGFIYDDKKNENCVFVLQEYGNQQVKGENDYSVKVQSPSGKKYDMYAKGNNHGLIWLDPTNYSDFVDILKESGTVKIYMEEDSYGTPSSYRFAFDTYNFSEKYKEYLSMIK